MTQRPQSRPFDPRRDPAGMKVTVVGLGRFGGGVGVTRWLCGRGADVTVTDKSPPEELADSVAALAPHEPTLHLGGHDEHDFTAADLIVANPAVPPDLPQLAAAREAGVPVTTEINLFMVRCAAPIVGVTGSVGKSTTAAMAAAVLGRKFKTHLGGNIGKSLLEDLPQIRPGHVVVLELSSFQLEYLPQIRTSPHVAVVTNLMPNHLDRHGTMDAYAAAKKNIFAFQGPDDVLVVNARDEAVSRWADEAPGRCDTFESEGEPFELAVPGRHNQANAQAAWAAAGQFGISRRQAAEALKNYSALPHRLELVAWRGGVAFYNDSKCTTPAGAILALEAFEPRRSVIILGGYDKKVSFDELGRAVADRAKAAVAIGATQAKITAAVEKHRSGPSPRVIPAGDFDSAVRAAFDLADDGDAVLLSPACASYDMFINYEHRGRRFVDLVNHLPQKR